MKKEKFIPTDNQLACAEHMLKNPCSGAFLDMGEGKTSTTCMVMSVLKKKKMFKPVLLVTTKEIMDLEVWPEEFKRFGWGFTSCNLHGKHKDKLIREDYDFYIINFEGLHWLLQNKKYLKTATLVIDESDKAKAYNTARFKLFKKILPMFNRRYLLTGTPAAEGYMGLFAQIYILDEGERLGQYITHFRNKFFTPAGYKGYQYVLQEDGAERIHKAIKDIIFTPEENSIKLPPPKFIDHVLKLPKATRKKYDQLEQEFIFEHKGKMIPAVSSAAKRGKLKQFCNGSVYDEYKNVVPIHNVKINRAKKIVKELKGEPILIGYEFRHDLLKLLKAFPDAPFYGTTLEGKKPTTEKKRQIQKLWNMGKIPVLIGQIESIARGLNLQKKGYHMMMYGHIDKFGTVTQFIARLRRRGQKNQVIVHRLIIEDSVDQDVIASNEAKDNTEKGFLNAMRKRVNKRKRK